MQVDYSRAEVPERSYYADYCHVQKARVGFSLVFGKLVPESKRLRTKIEIAFPEEIFTLHLWNNSRSFHETVRRLTGQPLPELDKVEDTEKVQTFRSNNVFMGVWGQDAVADFYYISPRDIHMLRTKNADVNLEPVVRVAMETALMLEFLEKCRPFVDRARAVDVAKEVNA
jgi:hypothetical protein